MPSQGGGQISGFSVSSTPVIVRYRIVDFNGTVRVLG